MNSPAVWMLSVRWNIYVQHDKRTTSLCLSLSLGTESICQCRIASSIFRMMKKHQKLYVENKRQLWIDVFIFPPIPSLAKAEAFLEVKSTLASSGFEKSLRLFNLLRVGARKYLWSKLWQPKLVSELRSEAKVQQVECNAHTRRKLRVCWEQPACKAWKMKHDLGFLGRCFHWPWLNQLPFTLNQWHRRTLCVPNYRFSLSYF